MARPKGKYTINELCLPVLVRFLGRLDDSIGVSDVVIVSIDFENAESIRKGTSSDVGCEIGIAILDTGQLHDLLPDAVSYNYCPGKTKETIETYNFATGPVVYRERKSGSFLFGETICINPEDMREKIHSCIPQDRKIVLVGHGLDNDLLALEILDIDFKSQSLLSIVDTFWISRQVFPSEPPYKLGRLLRRLGIQYPDGALHCAGNDANFSLRALLLLVARACQNADTTKIFKRARRRKRKLRKKRKGKTKRQRRDSEGNRRAARQDWPYRAQRAVIVKIQDEGGILEQGDILRLETCHDQERAGVAELQNEDYVEKGDLAWVEVSENCPSKACIAKPWGLEWAMMHDQA